LDRRPTTQQEGEQQQHRRGGGARSRQYRQQPRDRGLHTLCHQQQSTPIEEVRQHACGDHQQQHR
jgi:hypothetical protein